jgi:glycosyltransferase 2 family protein
MNKHFQIKKITKLIPIIGIILFLFILFDIGYEKIINAFSLIPWYYYLIALLFFIPKLLLAGIKWQYLNNKQDIHISFFTILKLYLLGLFYGSVTPGAIGMHIRVYYLRKKSQASFEKCIANSLIEGTLALIAGLFLAIIGSGLVLESYPGVLPLIIGFFILYTVAFTFFMEHKRGKGFFSFIIRPFLPSSYKKNIEYAISQLYKDIPRLRDLLIPFIIELVIWMIAATQVYILSLAFSISIPYIEFILLSIVSVIIANVIPLSIGGLGVREGAFVVLLSTYGVSFEIAFVLSLGGFLVKNLIPGLIGLIISILDKESPVEAIQSNV